MGGPLDGVRVVELGVMVAGPACAAILADWGAEVVKVEPPDGDPHRGNLNTALFELDNRGKRGICLDLKRPEAQEVLSRLLADADVLVTNLRLAALARLGLDYDTLSARFPRLVYAAATGYGTTGEGADKPGYDMGAYWSRAGVAHAVTQAGTAPPVSRPGMGDHPTGLALAAGVCAALVRQRVTGRGEFVTTSLLRTGSYTISCDLISRAHGQVSATGLSRMLYNPILAVYQAGDGRWFWLLGLQATRHWPNVVRAIGRPELATDPRFATMGALIGNRDEALALLDEAFAERPLDHWAEAFDRHGVWWDPVLSLDEVLADPLAHAAGVFRPIAGPDEVPAPGRDAQADAAGASTAGGGPAERDPRPITVATPVDFGSLPPGPAPRAPELGEHTEQVLLDLGYDWPAITALKDADAIP
ncbi:CoA transferase [Frankia sp. CNm7]|uniref:CoA transferase n=1 Tax=Frankia nepalensis TaxID=1836974 RepID=A0A937RKJ6_9ACTN|nr:CoA transferase [Frankia nepalensis]MBL7499478.1 CoA transferase [Frankia nepalensis]MBL7515367.1 CoA transferase [Frankia nepalensis]MBL7523084.1 CoA transferase [Frankia nepalensis]MBL7631852.1 CoA transferase [Frankia nepalensis]